MEASHEKDPLTINRMLKIFGKNYWLVSANTILENKYRLLDINESSLNLQDIPDSQTSLSRKSVGHFRVAQLTDNPELRS